MKRVVIGGTGIMGRRSLPVCAMTARRSSWLHLNVGSTASPRTIQNLKRNPAVEINVVNIFERRGYRFTGRASILPTGDDEYWMIADWVRVTNGPEYPVDHVVKIETTSIAPLLSPAHVFADPRRSQEEIRSTYYQKYGVKPSGHACRSAKKGARIDHDIADR